MSEPQGEEYVSLYRKPNRRRLVARFIMAVLP